MQVLVWIVVALAGFLAMEGIAWLSHRYVMHGWGWGWHKSHHAPRSHGFEANDLYALFGAALAIGLFLLARQLHSPEIQALAVGITAYGAAYALVHDGLVHQRWPFRYVPRTGYLRRLVQAHRIHHAVRSREDAVSYGFLVVRDPQRLAAEVKARRAQRRKLAESR